jgi:hypothetical protein
MSVYANEVAGMLEESQYGQDPSRVVYPEDTIVEVVDYRAIHRGDHSYADYMLKVFYTYYVYYEYGEEPIGVSEEELEEMGEYEREELAYPVADVGFVSDEEIRFQHGWDRHWREEDW